MPTLTPPESAAEPLELELEVEPPAQQAPNDELLLGATRLHEEDAQVATGRRRGLLSEEEMDLGGSAVPTSAVPEAAAAAPRAPRVGGGATLFERMANLSRGGRSTDDEDEDDDGPSISIPRFLGRQNNQ